jgi:tRNA threonylcarbamoyladenosine biosynthesis protein TsaB
MIVLAIETATKEGSVSLARDGLVLASQRGDGSRPHASRLPGDALALLGPHELTLGDVDIFAVCLGPGAFTGLRVGIAAAQGLAFGTARPIVGISALDALGVAALAGRDAPSVAGVWMDAARGEVFAARYVLARDEALGVRSIGEAVSAPAADVASQWADSDLAVSLWIGEGVLRYREQIGPGQVVEETPLLAPLVARLGTLAAVAGQAGAPHALRPIYVRPPDVELTRDRKSHRAADDPHVP